MEALSEALQPYKDHTAIVARLVTMAHMFSGTFMCHDIYKQGNTNGISITPFVGGLIMSVLNLKFGFILGDDTVIQVNFMGLALNIIYVMIFFHFTSQKMNAWMQMGLAVAFCTAVLVFTQTQTAAMEEYYLGMVITGVTFYLVLSPMFKLGDIIKNKSTEGLPFPIIFTTTIVTYVWSFYGIILKNNFIFIQSLVVAVICTLQLMLFVIYPSKPAAKPKTKAKKIN